ncbi:MAG TPA: cupin domain-containing protein [Thiolapillus brandeum]|uniref:Cupin domain-containing protein n=1 Tax=Thiolapillus brandeum TaxID=1076588 RepID=A0A831NRV2_9GAMM|nr:cupin domain-containing protein [Thiolapillus brandeum]
MQLNLPAALSAQDFLNSYWQKKPLLMRNAIQDYDFSLSPEELAGLACEEDIESRMVLQHGSNDWELRHGPFDEDTFAQLPKTNWTLLVQDVDKYIPHVASLMHLFRFIPSWRFDDIMISYAVAGGSVGPHTDTYDVFLIQAQGKRRWQIGNKASSDALLPDLPVRILADFAPEEEWLLEPGDVLYLPPGVAHWGIAEDDSCMTWSVGLRAPSVPEMLGSFTQYLLDHVPESLHYIDPDLKPQDRPAEIKAAAFAQADKQLQTWLDDVDLKQRWFGCFSTEVKEHLFIEALEPPLSTKQLLRKLEHGFLKRHPFSRYAWSERTHDGLYLFVCGEVFELPASCKDTLIQLCEAPRLGSDLLANCHHDKSFLHVLTELVNQNWLEFSHD